MSGIDPEVMVHKLNIGKTTRLVRQKMRNFAAHKYMVVAEEVDKLMDAEFIWEVHYLEWLSNMVMVKKANRKWRVCVDFTDLNKVYPTDSFSLPRIDTLMDSTSRQNYLASWTPSWSIIRFGCSDPIKKKPHSSQIEDHTVIK